MAEEAKLAKKEFDPFLAMDALDDEAILAEIEGRVLDKWVYHFPQEGQEVWGLSKVGVDAACREMAKKGEAIREEDVIWEVDPTDKKFVLFKAFAHRVAVSKDGKEIVLDRAIGTKRQCLYVVKKEGISNALNAFWFEQGSIKALRNARSRLLSEEIRAMIITKAKETGKVREVGKEENEIKKSRGRPKKAEPEAPMGKETSLDMVQRRAILQDYQEKLGKAEFDRIIGLQGCATIEDVLNSTLLVRQALAGALSHALQEKQRSG